MKFYERFDGHNMPTVWHDPNGDGYTPVPVLTKLHVPPGYWQEVVARLCADPPADHIVATNERLRERVRHLDKKADVWRQRAIDAEDGQAAPQIDDLIHKHSLALARLDSAQQTIDMLNAENRALIKALEDKRDRDTNPDTKDFLDAICGDGPRAGDWADKPHRLVYDLINKVTALHAEIRRLRDAGSDVRGVCGDCA